MDNVINLALLKNPVNWVIVTLIVMIAGLSLDLLTRSAINGE